MKKLRIVLGFIVAPLFAGVLSLTWSVLGFGDHVGRVDEFVGAVLFLAAFGFVAEIVVGIPVLLLGYRLRVVGLPLFLVGGVLSALALGIYFYFSPLGLRLGWFVSMVLIPAVAASWLLWAVGGWSSNHSFEPTRSMRRAMW